LACASRKKIGRAAGWAGEGSGPARGEVGPGEKKKEKGGLGRLGIKGRKKKSFCIFELIQTIQFKLKFREFKFEPNNKQ